MFDYILMVCYKYNYICTTLYKGDYIMKKLVPKTQNSENKTTTIINEEQQPKLGQWYWVTETCEWDNQIKGLKKGDEYTWLGCVMKIGSNFIELHTPHSKDGYSHSRIHIDEFWTRLRLEDNADAAIQQKIIYYQQESNRLLKEVNDLSTSLGLKSIIAIEGQKPSEETSTNALVVMSEKVDVNKYKSALVEAKEITLPELFKAIEKTNTELCRWLLATTMETKAIMSPMEKTISEVESRIFNVSLYAGLTEQVIKCSDGEPAGMLDKLHVMQRRLYMDEECLVKYEAGGMEFSDIHEFDKWISRPENRDRILPFPRTIVAMRVRREPKERDSEGSLLQAFINIDIQASDKFTYFYIRNGEQVWRMSCQMQFNGMIFPDKTIYDPCEAKMVKMFVGSVDKMISVHLYEELLAEYNENRKKSDKWREENPDTSGVYNPYTYHSFRPDDWQPFDPSNVYFDECMAEIEGKIKEYNRIAIIIQGLFDRSLILHPHPPVKTWTQDGFEKAIKLVYDGATTLYNGETPNFEAYRTKCNASLGVGSIVTGQELYWLKKEAAKENARLDNDYRNKSEYRHKTYRPYGNPGPGRIARIAKWKPSTNKAIFSWIREKTRSFGTVQVTLSVPQNQLFNISAYKLGDFQQFFNDPRTREQYLKWAPLLLTAEDYKAGKLQVVGDE